MNRLVGQILDCTLYYLDKRIQLLSIYDASRLYLNAGETLGAQTINTRWLHLKKRKIMSRKNSFLLAW